MANRLSPVDVRTCISLLQQCAKRNTLERGREIHSHMVVNGFHRFPPPVTALVNMYSKCSRVDHAFRVFFFFAGYHSVFAYNAMIAGFVADGRALEALELYWSMRALGVPPDEYTLSCFVKACCALMEVLEVRKVHAFLFKLALDFNVFVGSSLINAYFEFEWVEEARKVFEEMPVRDVVLWNALVNGYAQIGRFDEALRAFGAMAKEKFWPSSFTVTGVLSIFASTGDRENGRSVHGLAVKTGYDMSVAVKNALIDVYGKCQCKGDALRVFEMMEEIDIFSWNSVISVHEQCGDHIAVLRLFNKMLCARISPDFVTVKAALSSCAHLAALMHGREIHRYIIRSGMYSYDVDGIEAVSLLNALMDMYTKCGSMRNPRIIFDRIRFKHVASWNIMIVGYAMHGCTEEAFDMFSRMCETQLKPNDVTFVGILSACNHAGLINQGQKFFKQMETRYGVLPTIEHYTCIIDMLGRAGKLEEAYELVRRLPVQANPVIWRALLAAFRLQGNVDLAKAVAKRVTELDPSHSGSYILMTNIYGVFGRYEEVSEVRDTMMKQNAKKIVGCSWIELKDGVHTFVNGDRNHPRADLIYAQLISLAARNCEQGKILHL